MVRAVEMKARIERKMKQPKYAHLLEQPKVENKSKGKK